MTAMRGQAVVKHSGSYWIDQDISPSTDVETSYEVLSIEIETYQHTLE